MPATWRDAFGDLNGLDHRVRVARPVRGRELLEVSDTVTTDVLSWMDDPANACTGEFSLVYGDTVPGEGFFYTFGFSDPQTAEAFSKAFA